MPTFACKDLGMNCEWKAKANNETDLLKKIAEHAGKKHNLPSIPPDMMEKVNAAIKK